VGRLVWLHHTKAQVKVNEAKSAVARPQERKFLGFSFTAGPDIKRTIAPKSPDRFKQRIRDITRTAKGVSIKTTMEELATYMRGWRGYFGFCQTPEVLIALTRWVRLGLRAALWRQWKTPRRRRTALIPSDLVDVRGKRSFASTRGSTEIFSLADVTQNTSEATAASSKALFRASPVQFPPSGPAASR
jgi:RNA-directed DNA polymerase